MKTIDEIQNAIAKGKFVYCPTLDEGQQITHFSVGRLLTIECANVKRYGLGAVEFFLRHIIIL